MNTPSLLVHGGAWAIPDDEAPAHLAGCRKAAEIGWRVLQEGASALDAVTAAVRLMEDDPAFDAGTGAWLNASGEVELDAILMDGATLDTGAVAAVQRVRNPIDLARLVMERTEHSLLVGAGAEAFARTHGIPVCPLDELLVGRELERWQTMKAGGVDVRSMLTGSPKPMGTVGAVARDCFGNLAAATSTGGTPGKLPGRVGDSPLVGCGAYADNLAGAASATGWGETLMKVVFSKTAVDFARTGLSAQAAADAAIALLDDRVCGLGGIILLDRAGHAGIAFNTPRMARAWVTEGTVHARIDR